MRGWSARSALHVHCLSASCTPADDEMRLIERALRRNPKSYGAWHTKEIEAFLATALN